jgi:hypothetical protein
MPQTIRSAHARTASSHHLHRSADISVRKFRVFLATLLSGNRVSRRAACMSNSNPTADCGRMRQQQHQPHIPPRERTNLPNLLGKRNAHEQPSIHRNGTPTHVEPRPPQQQNKSATSDVRTIPISTKRGESTPPSAIGCSTQLVLSARC